MQEPKTIITTLEQSQQLFFKYAGTVKITSEAEQHNAEDLLIHARQATKEAEAKKKELKAPMKEAERGIDNLFDPYLSKLSMAITVVNSELQRYHTEKTREAEEARLLAMAEQAAKIAEANETGEIFEICQTSEIIPSIPKTSHANLGSVTYREGIEIIIVEPQKVPRDLCVPSLPLIRARAESGIRDIPGVLITAKTITVARPAK